MNESFDAARLHREELDREIETLRMERLINAAEPSRPGVATRTRAGIGRGLVSLGTALIGTADAAATAAASRSAGPRGRALSDGS